MSVVVRLPEEMVGSLRAYAALRGVTWQALLTEAWGAYKARHLPEWVQELREKADLLDAMNQEGRDGA